MKNQIFKGAGCAIVTPLNSDHTINYEKLGELIEFQINGKTDAIIIMGTTGEASAFYDEAHLKATEFCVNKVAGRVPVIAGCGSNQTEHGIKLSVESEKLGVDGLLHVTPYYNKTSQPGLIAHFTAIADSVNIPIILYNVPGRTGMTISADTYATLAKHPNIVATKEASGDISLVAQIAQQCGSDFGIYSGNDDQVLPILSLGGLGVISVLSNIVPEKMHDLCSSFFAGEVEKSRSIQLDIMPLNAAMFCEVNPIPVKEGLNQMGFEVGDCKLPLVAPSDTSKRKIREALIGQGLIQ